MQPPFHATRVPIPYLETQKTQRQLVERRRRGEIGDVLWLLEHPPTITWGRGGGRDNLRQAESILEKRGVAVCPAERGGNITFHAPGQLVGYPIVDLRALDRDLLEFLRRLERGLILALRRWGVASQPMAGRAGVWVGATHKIAALGVRAQRWISSHGFALNVENSLEGFEWIVPCGLRDAAVTSLERELGARTPPWSELCAAVHRALEESLELPLELVLGNQVERLQPPGGAPG